MKKRNDYVDDWENSIKHFDQKRRSLQSFNHGRYY